MNADATLFLKGLAMGAANVIPGVSGGTIALVTGVYQRLIAALGSIGPGSLRRLLTGDLKGFWQAVDGRWLSVLMAGVGLSVVSLAVAFEWLLEHHERATMAFFFGLILISIGYVARRVSRWSASRLLALVLGTAAAVSIAVLAPASENAAPLYLFVCGMVAISSMILPGLSGSFVLILMGNYALVLGAISALALPVLVPFALGCAIGIVVFSHALKWIFERHEDVTLALMTGFVLGSLAVIWPWKQTLTRSIERAGDEPKVVVTGYDWFLPPVDASTLVAVLLALAGGALIVAMERLAAR